MNQIGVEEESQGFSNVAALLEAVHIAEYENIQSTDKLPEQEQEEEEEEEDTATASTEPPPPPTPMESTHTEAGLAELDLYAELNVTWKACNGMESAMRVVFRGGEEDTFAGKTKNLFNKDAFSKDMLSNGPICISKFEIIYFYRHGIDEVCDTMHATLPKLEIATSSAIIEGVKKFAKYAIVASRSFCVNPAVRIIFADNREESVSHSPDSVNLLREALVDSFRVKFINNKRLSPNDKNSLGYVESMLANWLNPQNGMRVASYPQGINIALVYTKGSVTSSGRIWCAGWGVHICRDDENDEKSTTDTTHKNVIYIQNGNDFIKHALPTSCSKYKITSLNGMQALLDLLGLSTDVCRLVETSFSVSLVIVEGQEPLDIQHMADAPSKCIIS